MVWAWYGKGHACTHISNCKSLSLESDGNPVLSRRTGRVDIHENWLVGRIVLQEQELTDDQLSHLRIDSHTEVNDAVVQQQRGHIWRRANTCTIFHHTATPGIS